MSKVILYIAMSVDGYIATPDGSVAWLDRFNDTGDDYGYGEFIKNIGANIQGAVTYKQILGFDVDWPYPTKSYVLTNDDLPKPAGADVEFVQGDLQEIVKKAKNHTNKDIWLLGGANVAQQFLAEGLVDEAILSVMPVLLGSGISLFGDSGRVLDMSVASVETYNSGVLTIKYIPEGK